MDSETAIYFPENHENVMAALNSFVREGSLPSTTDNTDLFYLLFHKWAAVGGYGPKGKPLRSFRSFPRRLIERGTRVLNTPNKLSGRQLFTTKDLESILQMFVEETPELQELLEGRVEQLTSAMTSRGALQLDYQKITEKKVERLASKSNLGREQYVLRHKVLNDTVPKNVSMSEDVSLDELMQEHFSSSSPWVFELTTEDTLDIKVAVSRIEILRYEVPIIFIHGSLNFRPVAVVIDYSTRNGWLIPFVV